MRIQVFGLKLHLLLTLLGVILLSCNKMGLIDPPGLETQVEADTIVFAVIGDYGEAGEAEEKVADMVKSWNPAFILTTGDNNYNSGKLGTIQKNISAYYGDYIYNFDAPVEYRCEGKAFAEGLNRFFPSPGNHDANNEDGLVPYLNFFTLPHKEAYYSFVWGSVTFFSLNSCAEDLEDQQSWLEEELSRSDTPFKIVYFHHAPYSPGPHGNTERMQWDCFKGQVDLVISGHDHLYSRISKRGEADLYYLVNGLGGRSLYDCDSNPLPVEEFDLFCYDADYGAIKAISTDQKLIVEFYSVSETTDPVDRLVLLK